MREDAEQVDQSFLEGCVPVACRNSLRSFAAKVFWVGNNYHQSRDCVALNLQDHPWLKLPLVMSYYLRIIVTWQMESLECLPVVLQMNQVCVSSCKPKYDSEWRRAHVPKLECGPTPILDQGLRKLAEQSFGRLELAEIVPMKAAREYIHEQSRLRSGRGVIVSQLS